MVVKFFRNVNPCLLKIHHIYAVSYRRYIAIKYRDYDAYAFIPISKTYYEYLKNEGVPTSQYLRYHKEQHL